MAEMKRNEATKNTDLILLPGKATKTVHSEGQNPSRAQGDSLEYASRHNLDDTDPKVVDALVQTSNNFIGLQGRQRRASLAERPHSAGVGLSNHVVHSLKTTRL